MLVACKLQRNEKQACVQARSAESYLSSYSIIAKCLVFLILIDSSILCARAWILSLQVPGSHGMSFSKETRTKPG